MGKTLVDKKMSGFLFFLCWAVYFTSYIGRLNYSSVMSSIIEDGILSFSQAGSLGMIYFFAYAIGQLANGILGDKVNPRNMIAMGLALSALANMSMGLAPQYPFMATVWGINGYAQSMLWPPLIRIFAEKYPPEIRIKNSINIASSMALGTLTSYFLSACMLQIASWKWAFFLASALLIGMLTLWLSGYAKVERFLATHGVERASQESNPKTTPACVEMRVKTQSTMAVLLNSSIWAVLLPVVIHGILKDGMTQWVPTYIYDQFDVTASFSVIITMVLPLINLSGAYLAGFVDKRNHHQEIQSSIYFFGIATLSLLALYTVGRSSVFFTVLLFAIITAAMMAVNTLFINLVPLHFEAQGKVSTVSGFLNAFAYLGSAISTYLIGVLIEHFGWNTAIQSWITVTVVAFLCVLFLRKAKI